MSTREETGAIKAAAIAPPAINAKPGSPSHSTKPWPEEPLVVVEPTRTSVALTLRELWAFRELFYFLIWRDLKVRYKQTAFGVVWVVMQPLLATLIFTIFLGQLARVPSDGIPYALFAYAGLAPWSFFSSSVTNISNSLVGSSNLITKVYFPRLIIPGAAVGARLVDFSINLLVMGGMMLYYRVTLTWHILMLPVLVALTTLLALGIGMWTSALNVKYRDVGTILPVLVQLWMYVSPVLYPSTLVPGRWQLIYNLNPLTGILNGFRATLLGQQFNWAALAISTLFTFSLLVYGAYIFQRMEKSFADIV